MSSYQIIVPVFALIGVGYAAARSGLIAPAALSGLSQFVFNVAVPALLFRSLSTRGLQASSGWPLLLGYYGPALAIFGAGWLLARPLSADLRTRAVTAMGGSYGNCALLGVPLVLEAYGEDAAAPFFVLLAVHGPLMMTVAAITFERAQGSAGHAGEALKRTARGLLHNPIVLSLLSGSLMSALSIPLPTLLDDTLSLLGRAAVPCALFTLGGSLTQYRAFARLDLACLTVALKLVALPAGVWLVTGWLGVPPLERRVATVTAAMPTGVNVFLFADRYRADVGAASSAVLLSTALAMPGLGLLLWLLSR